MDRSEADSIELIENVSYADAADAKKHLKGYYVHILALDDCLKSRMDAIDETGLTENTILMLWSDHGDMILSRGEFFNQCP